MQRLIAIMEKLRDPVSGCPWDVQQDFRSIAPYTIEEAYEVADAIERGDLARDQNGILPVSMSLYITQSPAKE